MNRKTKTRIKAKRRRKPVFMRPKKAKPNAFAGTPLLPLFVPEEPRDGRVVGSLEGYREKVSESYRRIGIPPSCGDETYSAVPDSEWVWSLRRVALEDGTLLRIYLRDLFHKTIGDRLDRFVKPLRDLKAKIHKRIFRTESDVRKEAEEAMLDEMLGWMRFSSGWRKGRP